MQFFFEGESGLSGVWCHNFRSEHKSRGSVIFILGG